MPKERRNIPTIKCIAKAFLLLQNMAFEALITPGDEPKKHRQVWHSGPLRLEYDPDFFREGTLEEQTQTPVKET